jgi:hypothetical protein
MTRHKQRPKPKKYASKHQRQIAQAQKLDAVIRDTARVFACAAETAGDCATECERRLLDVDADLNYRRLPHEIWNGRPGRVQALATAMADLITENERHRTVISELFQRFDDLAEQEDFHEHIELPENYLDRVRALFVPPVVI